MDRVSGAIMGALIGDALGLGCHWYYDLAELRKDYGPWINGYTTPKPDRYHGGMSAGQISQTGLIFVMLLRSLAEHGEYREEDFTRRLDEELFPLLNGTPVYGPGGYTSQSIREAYRRRVEQGKTWRETGGMRIPRKLLNVPLGLPRTMQTNREKLPRLFPPIVFLRKAMKPSSP